MTSNTRTDSNPRQPGVFRAKIDKLKAALLKAVVPVGMRRAIFAVSLVARLKHISTPDKELAKRVGVLMDLTCDPASLLYPMQINGWIWKNLPVEGIDLSGNTQLTSEQLHAFCTAVISNTPEAIQYSTQRAMREDVYRLVMAFTPSSAARVGNCLV